MKHNLLKRFFNVAVAIAAVASVNAQQLPDPSMEDWSGSKFDGAIQPKYWHGSNVSQSVMNVNFTFQEKGHTGSYCIYIADKDVKFASLGATSPGYVTLGTPWSWLSGLNINSATAGTYGGINFTYRPDAMKVWIKRTGSNTSKENYNIIFYSWKGTAKGKSYKNKDYGCSEPGSPYNTDEESDIRIALNKNLCSTSTAGTQVAEGWIKEKKSYSNWTQITIPIYYFNNEVPEKTNIIFSAGNYPNFRDNTGIYDGNGLYIDDVELVYNSNIEKLFVGGEQWDKFQDTEDVQIYTLGEGVTTIPSIYGMRGAGVLENDPPTHDDFAADYNSMKAKVNFPGRRLSDSEMTVSGGSVNGDPVTITVKAQDGSSTHTYKIKFVTSASTNAKLAGIQYNGTEINGFNAAVYNYDVALPFGTTAAPVITATKGESSQTLQITQATSPTGKATIKVTAQDGKTTATYTINFSVRELDDITLKDILINGKSLTGFKPSKRSYTVNITSEQVPTVTPVSAYATGLQTIKVESNTLESGCKITVAAPATTEIGTYTLKYKVAASDYAYLADIKVGGTSVEGFDPEVLEYNISLPMGTSSLPAITWTTGDQYQTVEKAEGGVDGTTRLTVTAGDKTTKVIYKLNFSTAKSSNNALKAIFIDGKALEGFSPDQLSYEIPLPTGVTTLPEITYTQGDEYQTVTVTSNAATYLVRILVVAGDGSKRQYQLQFTRNLASDPTLLAININGQLIEGFESSKTDYYIQLPNGTTELPEITFQTRDEWQSVTTRSMGVNGDYKITVRAQSGDAITYIIHFSVIQSDNTKLAGISFEHQAQTDFVFNPDITEYTVTLPEGAVVPSSISYEKSEESQKVVVTRKNKTYELLVTAESGAQQTYIITFVLQVSADANLKMIYLNGERLKGFDEKIYEYDFEWDNPICPTITVDKASPTQQVSIVAPISFGTAQITVVPEGAEAGNTYLIHINAPEREDIQLRAIMADGIVLEDFEPSKASYDVVYQTNLPKITYLKRDNQEVSETANTDSVVLVVKAGEYKKIYVVHLIEQKSSDATLSNITLSAGELMPAFSSQVTNYTVTLQPGEELPNVSYQVSSDKANITAGMTSATQFSAQVTAQDGITQLQYIVDFEYAKYGTTELVSLEQANVDILQDGVHQYDGGQIDKGAQMPELTYTAGNGQITAMTNTDNLHQEILVVSDEGQTATYNVAYTTKIEANALLNDIQLFVTTENGREWISLPNFDKNGTEFTYELPWRTKVVPCIHPIGAVPDQEITITYGQINGQTQIHVVAEDGETNKTYTLNFPVWKSDSVLLKSLTIVTLDEYDEEEEHKVDVKLDEYAFSMPLGSTARPDVRFEKAIPEQTIEFIDAPLGGTTQIIVTAENGDKKTYSLTFPIVEPEGDNVLESIYYSYIDAFDIKHKGVLDNPTSESDINIQLPYRVKSFSVDSVKKTYAEQSVYVIQGGIYAATELSVIANKSEQTDKTYRLVPVIEQQNPAVLDGISVNGTPIADFDKNRFVYVVNVSTSPIVTTTGYNGTFPNIVEASTKHWEAVVTKDGFSNTYEIWYYYPSNVIPNSDFTNWTTAKNNSAAKPENWQVLADYFDKFDAPMSGSHTFGKNGEVEQTTISGSNKAVHLNSKKSAGNFISEAYGGALGGYLPAWITLGSISGNLAVAGGSTFQSVGGIPFFNSPDQLVIKAKTGDLSNGKNRIVYQLWGNGQASVENSTTANTDYKEYTFSLAEANAAVTVPTQMNIILNSFDIESCHTLTEGGAAELYVDYVRFKYNGALKALTVNNDIVSLKSKKFTYTMPSSEDKNIPVLTFIGEVSDQAQRIVWDNDSLETIDGANAIRRATIYNIAEDGAETTYTLEITRPLSTIKSLANISVEEGYSFTTAFAEDKLDYIVDMPYGAKRLPDVQITRGSQLQTIQLSKSENVLTYTVTAENGDKQDYTITFRHTPSTDATLQGLTCDIEGGISYEESETTYNVSLANNAKTPAVNFTKKMDGQTVDVLYGDNSTTLHVTAEDGTTTNDYTINYTRADEVTTANFTHMSFGGINMSEFESSTYSYEQATKRDQIGFVREFDSDKVVERITQDSVEWLVEGSVSNTYKILFKNEPSDNTDLAAIYVNGKPMEDFLASTTTYTISSDTAVNLTFVPAELKQTITLSLDESTAGNSIRRTFVVTVKSETGLTKEYRVTVQPELSNNSLLKMIYADGEELSDFDAVGKTEYHIVLANPQAGMPKTEQPQLPNITYTLGQESQMVEVIAEAQHTQISVKSEDELSTTVYNVYVDIEPSHWAEFTGISINNQTLNSFRQDRNFYYVQVNEDQNVVINYTAEDRYQTVEESEYQDPDDPTVTIKVLTITAEDGVTQKKYEFAIIRNALSSDAMLANITLDDMSFADYAQLHGIEDELLPFDPFNPRYIIPLKGETKMPDINIFLKEDGQKYEMTSSEEGYVKTITVTAIDGSKLSYVLTFKLLENDDATLSAIYIDNEAIEFTPDKLIYNVPIYAGKVGNEKLPTDILAVPTDWKAAVAPFEVKENTVISVVAENGMSSLSYTLNFIYIYSDADTLAAITADNEVISGFRPDSFYYSFQLPVGAEMPIIDYDVQDEYQTINKSVIENGQTTTTQFDVVAGSGKSNVYTIVYEKLQSSNANLANIFVGGMPIEGFDANKTAYTYILPIGSTEIPEVTADQGDIWQQNPEVEYGALEDYTNIVAKAQDGTTKTYSIRFTVALSDNPFLKMISISNEEMRGFQSEVTDYVNIPLPYGTTTMPLITFEKAEEQQTVTIEANQENWTARLVSTAADGISKAEYNLSFSIRKSDADSLLMIYIAGEPIADFRSDDFEYEFTLPYGSTNIPTITWDKSNEQQNVTIQLPDTLQPAPWDALIKVVSGSEDYENQYRLRFAVEGSTYSLLEDIIIQEESVIDQFVQDTASGNYVYSVRYVPKTPISDFIQKDQIEYVLGHDKQIVTISDTILDVFFEKADTILPVYYINLMVQAESGNVSVYELQQYAGLNNNALLRSLLINDEPMRNFCDTVYDYSYLVFEGVQSVNVEAIAQEEDAIVTISAAPVGDTTIVRCVAADGTRAVYRISVETSEISTSQEPTSSDVVLKSLGNGQFIAMSLRDNVQIAVFNMYGYLILKKNIPVCNPNSVIIDTNSFNQEEFYNGDDMSNGTTFTLEHSNIPYFYVFFYNSKVKLKSGKIIVK